MRAALTESELFSRLDAVAGELVDIVWSALAAGRGDWNTIGVDIDQMCGDNLSRATLMHEVHMIYRLAEIMGEVSAAALEQARAGLASLSTFELAKPVALNVPDDRHGKIRRHMLRAIFNAACFLDDDGKRQSADLGRLWFASGDDRPLIHSTDEMRRRVRAKFKASKRAKSDMRNRRHAEKNTPKPRPTGWVCVNTACSCCDVLRINAGNCVICGAKLLPKKP